MSKTLQELVNEKKRETNPYNVVRLWNLGHTIQFDDLAIQYLNEFTDNFTEILDDWSDEEKQNAFIERLDKYKQAMRENLSDLQIPDGMKIDDIVSGYLFAIWGRAFKTAVRQASLSKDSLENYSDINSYILSGSAGLLGRKKRLAGPGGIVRTKLKENMINPKKDVQGQLGDKIKYEEVPTITGDITASSIVMGVDQTRDGSAEICIYDGGGDLRASIIAISSGGNRDQSEEINEEVGKISNLVAYEFVNYMAANIGKIEGMIASNKQEKLQEFLLNVNKLITEETRGNSDYTPSIACVMLVKIGKKYYHVSVNTADGVVWKVNHDDKQVVSLVDRKDEGLSSSFGEISLDEVVVVGSQEKHRNTGEIYGSTGLSGDDGASTVAKKLVEHGGDHPVAVRNVGALFGAKKNVSAENDDLESLTHHQMSSYDFSGLVQNPNKFYIVHKQRIIDGKITSEDDRKVEAIKNFTVNSLSDVVNLLDFAKHLITNPDDYQEVRNIIEEKLKDLVIRLSILGDSVEPIIQKIKDMEGADMFKSTKSEIFSLAPDKMDALLKIINDEIIGSFDGEDKERKELIKVSQALPIMQDDAKAIRAQLFKLIVHASNFPAADAKTKRGREAMAKRKKIIALAKKIYHCDKLEDIQSELKDALTSMYKHAHQTNEMLVNRGTHLYWVHSLFAGKRNKVDGHNRLSRSKTEDDLIDLKGAVDKAVNESKAKSESGKEGVSGINI